MQQPIVGSAYPVAARGTRRRRAVALALTAVLVGLTGLVGTALVDPGPERAAASGGRCGDPVSTAIQFTAAVEAWEDSGNPCTDIVFAGGGPLSLGAQSISDLASPAKALIIRGNGVTLTESALGIVSLGDVTVSDLDFLGDSGDQPQLIVLTPGDITVTDSTFAEADHTPVPGSAPEVTAVVDLNPLLTTGGAVLVSGTVDEAEIILGEGTIRITGSSFVDNVTNGVGGFAAVTAGLVQISDVVVSGNQASAVGGAVIGSDLSGTYVPERFPDIEIRNSTFTDNQSGMAGGLAVAGADVLLDGVEVSDNVADIYGGGYLIGTEELVISNTSIYENAGSPPGDLASASAADDDPGGYVQRLRDALPTAEDLRADAGLTAASGPTTESQPGIGAALVYAPVLTLDSTTVAFNLGLFALAIPEDNPLANVTASTVETTTTISRSLVVGNGFPVIAESLATVYIGSGDIDIDSSMFYANTATIGAVGSFGAGELLIRNSTFSDNTGGEFGVAATTVYSTGPATVVNSTFVDNVAREIGAIVATALEISSSTFVGNRSLGEPGAPLAGAAAATSSLIVSNSIFHDNLVGGEPGALRMLDPNGTLEATASLFTTAGEVPAAGDGNIVGDPQLGELDDNGGTELTVTFDGDPETFTIPTMLPAASSPVVDAGVLTADLPTFDQRGPGFWRVSNGAIDMGSVEIQTDPPPGPPVPPRPGRPIPVLPTRPVPPAAPPTPDAAGFRPLAPVRLLDTRSSGPVVPGTLVRVPVGPYVGVDASAVALNITALGTTAQGRRATSSTSRAGFVAVVDCESPIPEVSNLNFTAGAVVPNAAIAALGDDGEICLVVSAPADLLVDLEGWFDDGYTEIGPRRVFDSRRGAGTVAARSTTRIALPPLPTGSTAAVVNITAVDAAAAGFLSVSDCSTPPSTSALNVGAGQTVAGLALTAPSDGVEICVYSSTETGLIVDLFGVVDEIFTPVEPARLLDTRGGPTPAAGSVTRLSIGGRSGVPTSAGAVVVTVTAVDARATGYITVYPCETTPPNVSNLNPVAGSTVANTSVVGLSSAGELCVFSSGATDLLVDLSGWFTTVG